MTDERTTEELWAVIDTPVVWGEAQSVARHELVRRLEQAEDERDAVGENADATLAELVETRAELAEARGKLETLAQDYTRVMVERDEAREALRDQPGQPLLNAARALVRATDNAERSATLGDLYNALRAVQGDET